MQGIYNHLKTYRWPYLVVVSVLIIDVLLRFLAIDRYSCNPCWIFGIPLPFDGAIKLFVSQGSLPWDIQDPHAIPVMDYLGLIVIYSIGLFAFRNRWISASMALFALSFINVAEALLNSTHVTMFAFRVNFGTTLYFFDTTDMIAFAALVLYCGVQINCLRLKLSKKPSNVWIVSKIDEYEAKKKLIGGVAQAGATVDKQ